MNKNSDRIDNVGNDHVREYLTQFVDSEQTPQYAVMLKGEWGSGKTEFIKNFLESKYPTGEEYALTSLNGIETNQQFYAALYAKLVDPTAAAARRLVATIAGALSDKIDFESLLNNLSSDAKNRLIIFDDLERSAMGICSVMGLITRLVEHDHCKVIVICNEEEVIEDDLYKRTKEKLIGNTFHISAEISVVLSSILQSLNDDDAGNFVVSLRHDIQRIFRESQTNNLRVLERAVEDVVRFVGAVDEKFLSHKDAIAQSCGALLAFAIDTRVGRLDRSSFEGRFVRYQEYLSSKGKRLGRDIEPDSMIESIDRYSSLNLDDVIIPDAILVSMLFDGKFSGSEINSALSENEIYVATDEEYWRVVWHAVTREDIAVDRAVSDLESRIQKCEITDTRVILHWFGLLLFLSEIGFENYQEDSIEQIGKKYVDSLVESELLEPMPFNQSDDFDHAFHSYFGLEIRNNQHAVFTTLRKYLTIKRIEARDKNILSDVDEILKVLQKSPSEFCKNLVFNNSESDKYYRYPVMIHVDVDDFIAALSNVDPESQLEVIRTLNYRWTESGQESVLEPEIGWRASLIEKFKTPPSGSSLLQKFRFTIFARILDRLN